ncbi:hypothetical protein HG530_001681 [Fusarium avenaceum]|nr:hypothetical protein HG530_001681 [Fusarium avenaceum]
MPAPPLLKTEAASDALSGSITSGRRFIQALAGGTFKCDAGPVNTDLWINNILLFLQTPIWLQNLEFLEFRTEILNMFPIIEFQLPLLHKLHASNPCKHFGARGDPVDIVQSHGLLGIETSLACGVGKDLAIFADHYDGCTRDACLLIGAGIVNYGL